MAEKNYLSSSQESLPLSEESFRYLFNQLDSPLNEIVNNVSGVDAIANQECPDLKVEPVSAAADQEYPVMEQVTESYPSIPHIESRPQFLFEGIPKDQKIPPSSLPAMENWPGDYNFNVTFRMQENVKGAQCVYSKLKNKLYVGKDVPCPINFATNKEMTDVYIRAMALFSSADHASQIVHRCVNHSMSELQQNLPEAEHLVRCESRCAMYVNDPATGRHSVIVPFENPPAGQHFSSYIYKFACFGSCSGGPNRRPLMLVFTLEKGGAVIGRQKVDLKICACPSRDMKLDEKQLNSNLTDKNPTKRKSQDPAPRIVDTVPNFHSAVKKFRPDSGTFCIKVQDRKCYDFLKLMKKCFFLYLNKPSSDIEQNIRNAAFVNFIRSTFSSSEDEGN